MPAEKRPCQQAALIMGLAVLVLTGTLLATPDAQEPYRRMLDQPLRFTGAESQAAEPAALSEIRIGLYTPDRPEQTVGQALTRGATLAVEQANAAGGYQGVPFRLVRRWAEDPWSGGAKEVIRLVYEDRVWALIGSVDGASSHVVQQIATKAHLPLIAPISSDPSLTHARVPWIFRLAPDDDTQAQVLVAELVRRHLSRVGIVTGGDHDAYTAATELVKEMAGQGTAPAFQLQAPATAKLDDLVRRIIAFKPDGLVVRLAPAATTRLVAALATAGLDCPLLLPWVPGAGLQLSPAYPGAVLALAPFHRPQRCGPYLKLVHTYSRRFGEYPLASAAYGFDAATLIIEAIRRGGLQRRAIRDQLVELSGYSGATGTIAWDNGGGNRSQPVLTSLPSEPSADSGKDAATTDRAGEESHESPFPRICYREPFDVTQFQDRTLPVCGLPVIVEATIRPDGTVKEVSIIRSLNPEIDQAVVENLAEWLFEPSDINDLKYTLIARIYCQ